MSASITIVLMEILFLLVLGIGFFLFKAHKKKQAMSNLLNALLKKLDNDAVVDRKSTRLNSSH